MMQNEHCHGLTRVSFFSLLRRIGLAVIDYQKKVLKPAPESADCLKRAVTLSFGLGNLETLVSVFPAAWMP